MTTNMFRLSYLLIFYVGKTTFATSETETAYLSVTPELRHLLAAQSLIIFFCVTFVDHCLSSCPFSFSHCIVCPSINGFWL